MSEQSLEKQELLVSMKQIRKSFAGGEILHGVDFDLFSGEVLAFLGENGAGKSTLMNILCGIIDPNAGSIEVYGKKYEKMDQKLADSLGIALVHQELSMCPDLSVAENIFLGREIKKSLFCDKAQMEAEAARIFTELNVDIDPAETVKNLPVSKCQMIEIAKALIKKPKILIMDEPTSALTVNEINELFRIINKLKSEGCGIVYISHRLEELKHIVDRVTILRDGYFVMTKAFDEISMDDIISNMVGHKITVRYPHVECERGEKILEIKGINAGPRVRNVSFDVYKGEILGVAGLMGAGRTETTRALFGADRKRSGKLFMHGKRVRVHSPIDAIKKHIALVPEDRMNDGLCTKLSIRENISLPNLKKYFPGGFIDRNKEHKYCENIIEKMRIKLSSEDEAAGNLSGGNQQKIVVGKWLDSGAEVIIFDEPTRGIDISAKVEIYNIINELKMQGIGVVLVSSEMPELLGMSDRIIVMCDGRITGELSAKDATQEDILRLATKFENKLTGKKRIPEQV